MGKWISSLLLIFYVNLSEASHCDISGRVPLVFDQSSVDLSTQVSRLTASSICENFDKDDSYIDVKTKLETLVANQTNEIYSIKDRHDMGNALNTCEPNKNSKALVLSFAGTGAYNPRTHSLLAQVIQCQKFQNLSVHSKKAVYGIFFNELKNKNSAYTKWSGIDKGIMSSFISDPKLNAKAKDFDFATFASEESEMIADPQNISLNSLSSLADEVLASTAGLPKGIANAKKCLVKYAMKSKELGIDRKLIILSHSSGGRSAVKFLELMKQNEIKADLVITLDPVVEAQHAIGEVASQYAGRARDYLNPFTSNDKPVRVWSRTQPRKLYKTNAKKWISFYQTDDSKGLGTSPAFGIYGSPISGGENIKIEDTGASGHGKICYEEEVLEKMKKSILDLF